MTELEKLKSLTVVQEYMQVMRDGLRHTFPSLNDSELQEAIEWSVAKRFYNAPASIDNNYTMQRLDGTMLDVMQYLQKMEPIMTSSGVLFKKHKEADNPLARTITGFLKNRKAYKKLMFSYPKGSANFAKYNLLQLLEKLNANATYGVLGAPTAAIFNIYVAEAVTRQGRSYISSSIMLFESLLSNNVGFNNLDEVITFIHNVENERHERNYIDSVILDRNIPIEEVFFKLMNTADMFIWVPTDEEMALVWDYLLGLSQEDLNRLYYKNNLYEFCNTKVISDLIIKILCTLEAGFMDPNSPPDDVKDLLNSLVSLIKEYVYYHYFYIDKLDRIEYMQRDIVCISDTDSTIISFDAWYRFILDKVYNIDMPIKHKKLDMLKVIKADEFGDKPLKTMCTNVTPRFDYDFYTDEVIEMDRLREMTKIVPQEILRFSIINILGYICSALVVDYLDQYCRNTSSYEEGVKCRMVMKNEFLFERIMLTENRRNYAAMQELQEGNIIPKGKSTQLQIQGLPINKSSLSESVKDRLQQILYEDVMTAERPDQIRIIKQLAVTEKQIMNSIMKKETKYYRPDNIASLSSYGKDPLSINGIVAAMVYNEMRTEDMPAINLEERNKITKIKINVDKHSAARIKDKYPVEYEKLMNLLNHPTLGSKVHVIGLPADVEVPDWVLEFVDINEITSDALKNFPLESLGLKRMDNSSTGYSNIIQL